MTGASAGFGFETAKALAMRGHTVYASMRDIKGKNADKAKTLKNWAKEGEHPLHVLELDVSNDTSVTKAIANVVKDGGLDVVINNAGVGMWGINEGYTVEQAQQIFDVNLFGIMRVNNAVLPHFRKQGSGLIVYISSGVGRIVFPFMGIYVSSKFAVEGYAESTSYELAPLGIQSVIVQPGAYGTTFLANVMQPKHSVAGDYGPVAKMFEAFGSGFEERAKAGELGDPAEVVKALVEEVERPLNKPRALRRPVGADVGEPVTTINALCAQVQGQVLNTFGLNA